MGARKQAEPGVGWYVVVCRNAVRQNPRTLKIASSNGKFSQCKNSNCDYDKGGPSKENMQTAWFQQVASQLHSDTMLTK